MQGIQTNSENKFYNGSWCPFIRIYSKIEPIPVALKGDELRELHDGPMIMLA